MHQSRFLALGLVSLLALVATPIVQTQMIGWAFSRHCQVNENLAGPTPKMMGSSPAVNLVCWGSVSPILLNLTIPAQSSLI